MSESIFIETTIPSYYVARRSQDIVQAARQELTIDWWTTRRSLYTLYTSQAVLNEAGRGEAAMATQTRVACRNTASGPRRFRR